MNKYFNHYWMRLRKWLLQMKYLFFKNENTVIINGIKFILTWDISELQNMNSSGKFFLLGKTTEMIERCIALGQKQEIKKVFDMGILQGGSVVLYDKIYALDKIVAIDCMPQTVEALTRYIERHDKINLIKPYYGVDQADSAAMGKILSLEFPKRDIDLIVDDASHYYAETRAAFNISFPYLKAGGLYVIEDWGWAHWAGEPWQTEESPFGSRKAMSNLLIELFMLAAS